MEEHNYISSIWKQIVASHQLQERDSAVFFYSRKRLAERLEFLKTVFKPWSALHTVAIKTNPHPFVLKCIVDAGLGLEAASFEEVQLAIEAGASPQQIVYNSPVKTRREIATCIEDFEGLHLNVNSIDELKRIPANSKLHLGLRVNPIAQPGGHEMFNVSGEDSKFGVPITERQAIIQAVYEHQVSTLHLHVGSQVADVDAVVDALSRVVDLANEINAQYGQLITTINIGGGIPAGESIAASEKTMAHYTDAIAKQVPQLTERYGIITEFGQWVHKHNGVVFSSIEYIKHLPKKQVAYVHVGADLFMREVYAKTGRLDFIFLNAQTSDPYTENTKLFDIAGPLCFNGDYLAKEVLLPALKEGDIMAIPSAGANNYGLWSRHCSRDIPAMWSEEIELNRLIKVSDRAKGAPSH
jgi:diaminopimelate decarboxylase